MGLVVPAVLPSSHNDLEEKLALLSRIPSVDRIQIDVVDGRFVSPASWPYSAKASQGTPYTGSTGSPQAAPSELSVMVQKGEMLPYLDHFACEIDLMCLDAEQAAGLWLALGATRLTFHAESVTDIPRMLASLRRRYGAGAGFASDLVSFGLALNTTSDLALIEPCMGEIEYVQLMGIASIGRQGQPFDPRVLEQVRVFRNRHPEFPLQVDGGVSLESAKELIALNVSNLIIGSALLGANDPAAAVAAFEKLESPYGV